MKLNPLLFALGAAGVILSLSTASLGADGERVIGYTGPNLPMMTTGIGTFGLAYIPAVVVAGESTLSADHNLYVPLAGPWLDLAERPGCGGSTQACTTENTNKVLIGLDGVFQGAGAVLTVVGLLTTEHRVIVTRTAKSDKPTIQVSPAILGTGYGMAAVGSW